MKLHTDKRNTTPVTVSTKIEVKRLANFKCVLCSESETQWLKLEIHLLVRRFDGGTNQASNLIVVCPNCHSKLHSGDNFKTR